MYDLTIHNRYAETTIKEEGVRGGRQEGEQKGEKSIYERMFGELESHEKTRQERYDLDYNLAKLNQIKI